MGDAKDLLLWDFPPPSAVLAWCPILLLKTGQKCGNGHGWGHNSRAHVLHGPGQMGQVARVSGEERMARSCWIPGLLLTPAGGGGESTANSASLHVPCPAL